MNIKKKLANRTHEVEWSGIRVVFNKARNIEGVIDLGIGQPDFDTPQHIVEAGKAALDAGYTKYPPTRGFPDVRKAAAVKLKRENNIIADPDTEIFIAVGAMQGIFNTALHILNPGDEVIVLDPGYDFYSQIRLFGGVPVAVPVREENRFKLDTNDVRKAITPHTKLMIISTPSNPTGAVFDKEILLEVAEVAREHEIFILADEPYERIVFDGKEHFSIGSLESIKELSISTFTLSKTYAMTGWRVGYTVADKIIIDEMEKLMEHMVSGVTAVSQRVVIPALTESQECVNEMVTEYNIRRNLVYELLNEIPGVSCPMPEGAFYAFPNIKVCDMSSWDFTMHLLNNYKVAVAPGNVFGKNGEGYVRVSFAAGEDSIREGLKRFGECVYDLTRKK